MTDYVTREDLDDAIQAVVEDIQETEIRLRNEFTTTMRWELQRLGEHLREQDKTLRWINRWTLAALLSIITALIYFVGH